jgi:hypothetical protein
MQDHSTFANVLSHTDDLSVRVAGYTSQYRSAGRATVQTTSKEGWLVYPGYHCTGVGRSQCMATILQSQ